MQSNNEFKIKQNNWGQSKINFSRSQTPFGNAFFDAPRRTVYFLVLKRSLRMSTSNRLSQRGALHEGIPKRSLGTRNAPRRTVYFLVLKRSLRMPMSNRLSQRGALHEGIPKRSLGTRNDKLFGTDHFIWNYSICLTFTVSSLLHDVV